MELIERMENAYQFECEAGPLQNCVEWQQIKAGIETAVAALTKVKAEFRVAGKPAGYVGSIYVDTALAALRGVGPIAEAAARETCTLSRDVIVCAMQQTIQITAARYGAFDVNFEAIADAILAAQTTAKAS